MEMVLLLFIIGLTTGALSGLFGVGGGFILVPLLTLVGVSIKEAIALSLVYIIGTALSGLLRHFKQHTVDVALALSLSLSSIFTAQLGVMLTVGMSTSLLKILFGILTASVAAFYVLRHDPANLETNKSGPQIIVDDKPTTLKDRLHLHRHKVVAGEEYSYRINLLAGLAIGAVVGFVSGMFGVGGGFLMVPLMVTLLGVPLKIAVGTSLLCVIAPASSGSIALWLADKLDLHLLPALLVGGLLGAQIGARLLLVLKASTLKLAFNLLLIAVSGYMLALGTGLL